MIKRWVWSYSKIQKYETCPHAYYLCYVAGFDEPETPEMVLGKETHALIQAYLTGSTISPASSEARELARKVIGWVRESGLRPVAVEEEFDLPLDENNRLTGFVDAVLEKDGQHILLDWKTGWNRFTVQEKYQQLGLYVWAARQTGYPIKNCGYMFVRFRSPFQWAADVIGMEEKAMQWAHDLIQQASHAHRLFENGAYAPEAFPAMPGSACLRCAFINMCPLNNKYKEVS